MKSFLKKGLKIILIIGLLTTQMVTPLFANDAVNRVKNMIEFYQGKYKQVGELSLTPQEFKSIGVFVSNFYIPFQTKLNVGSVGAGEEEDTQVASSKKEVLNLLTTVATIDKEYATKLVDSLMEASTQTAAQNPLKLGIREVGSNQIKPIEVRGNDPVTFWEFSRLVLGSGVDSQVKYGYNLDEFKPNENQLAALRQDTSVENVRKNTRQMVLYYGNNIEVFSFIPNLYDYGDLAASIIPPSQMVFLQNMSAYRVSKASITSLHDVELENIDSYPQPISSLLGLNWKGGGHIGITSGEGQYDASAGYKPYPKTLSIEDLWKTSQANWNMWVDAFGNLLVDTKRSVYVMLPAAQNPYIYKDSNEKLAQGVPLNNLQSMSITAFADTNFAPALVQGIDKAGIDFTQIQSKSNYVSEYNIFTASSQIKDFNEFNGTDNDRDVGEMYLNYWSLKTSMDLFKLKSGGGFKTSGLSNQNVLDLYKQGSPNLMSSLLQKRNAALVGSVNEIIPDSYRHKPSIIEGGDMGSLSVENMADYLYKVLPYTQYSLNRTDAGNFGWVTVNHRSHMNFGSRAKEYASMEIPSMDQSLFNKKVQINKAYKTIAAVDTFGLQLDNQENADTIVKIGSVYNNEGTLATGVGSNTIPNVLFGKQVEDNKASIAVDAVAKSLGGNLFLTYIFSNVKTYRDKLGWSLDFSQFPSIEGINGSGDGKVEALTEEQKARLQRWAYLALDPSSEAGARYSAAMSQNKTNRLLLEIHEGITGSGRSITNTGTTKQDTSMLSFMGSPDLKHVPFIQGMLAIVTKWVSYLVIGYILYQIVLTLFGITTKFSLVFNIFIAMILMVLPAIPVRITNALTNRLTTSIYQDKMYYWGLMQHQGYIDDLNRLAMGSSLNSLDGKPVGNTETLTQTSIDSGDYFQTLLKLQNQTNPNFATAGVLLKWQSPKKDNYLFQVQKEMRESGISENLTGLAGAILQKTYSGEVYDPENKALYLYRTMLDINNYSRFIYGNTGSSILFEGQGDFKHQYSSLSEALSIYGMGNVYNSYVNGNELEYGTLSWRMTNGFVPDVQGTKVSKVDNLKRLYLPLSSRKIAEASVLEQYNNKKRNDRWGLTQDAYNIVPRNFNNHKQSLADQVASGEGSLRDNLPGANANTSGISSEEFASIAAHALYTESPYYYFNWMLYDNGLRIKPSMEDIKVDANGESTSDVPTNTTNTNTRREQKPDDSVKNFILSKNNEFFYNYKINSSEAGYGELKDFLDMGSLFRVVIPSLNKANQPLIMYDKRFGTTPYKHVTGLESEEEKFTQAQAGSKNAELLGDYFHNANLGRLFGAYSGWVDLLQSTSLSKPVDIQYNGEKQRVENPLDANEYKIRPMIFSESEMKYYGLQEGQLTSVEKKILKVNRNVYNDLLVLTNYANFDPTVIGNMMSLIATFNFNKEFSEIGFGESVQLYPIAFEVQTFSYDAYLRLVLFESMGLDSTYAGNIYAEYIQRSGLLGGIALILSDIISVYVVPVLRQLVTLMMVLTTVFGILAFVLDRSLSIGKTTIKVMVKPVLKLIAINVISAIIYSFFMSNGNTQVTGNLTTTINFKNPLATILILTLVGLVAVYFYFKLVVELYQNLKELYQNSIRIGVADVTRGVKDKVVNTFNTVRNGLATRFGIGSARTATSTVSGGGASAEQMNQISGENATDQVVEESNQPQVIPVGEEQVGTAGNVVLKVKKRVNREANRKEHTQVDKTSGETQQVKEEVQGVEVEASEVEYSQGLKD